VNSCLKGIFKKSIKQLMKNMGEQEAARSLGFHQVDKSIGKKILERGKD
jgi:hypothetical protein